MDLTYLLVVWNALADQREVLDKHATLGSYAATIAGRLTAAILAVTP